MRSNTILMKKFSFVIFLLLPLITLGQAEKRYRSIIVDSIKGLNGGRVDVKDTLLLDSLAVYNTDLSLQYTSRSLVDSAFIKTAISASGGNTIYSADDNLDGDRIVTMGANSLTFSGNLTTFQGINAAATSDVFLATDNVSTVLMVIENAGDVGIGLIDPLTRLHVKGGGSDVIRMDNSGGAVLYTMTNAGVTNIFGTMQLSSSTGQGALGVTGYSFHSGSAVSHVAATYQNNSGVYFKVQGGAANSEGIVNMGIPDGSHSHIIVNDITTADKTTLTLVAPQAGDADDNAIGIRSTLTGGTAAGNPSNVGYWANVTGHLAGGERNMAFYSQAGNWGIGVNILGDGATNNLGVFNGTAPSTSPVNMFQMYANDIVADNSAPHFRTENGDIIKLFADGSYVDPTGTSDKGTFATSTVTTEDLAEFVKAMYESLKANGLLKN